MAIAVGMLAVAAQTAAAADTISSPERCSPKFGCRFDAARYAMGVGESPLLSMPPRLDYPHDVAATETGADGRPLFKSAIIGAGKTAVVNGTEYLQPGVYDFLCTVHKERTIYGTRMEAKLVVQDTGVPPKPRPEIEVAIPRQPLNQVQRRGILRVAVSADHSTSQVKLIARKGRKKRYLAVRTRLSLEPGKRRNLELKLRPWARRELRDSDSVVISLLGADRFGEPDTARRRLR